MSIPGSLDLAGIADFRRCVTGGRWGSADVPACRAGPAAPAALHRGFEQVQVIPSRTAWGSPLQRPCRHPTAPVLPSGQVGVLGRKGKKAPGKSWCWSQFLGESISAVAVVPPALCSLSLSISIKFTGMLLSETPALHQTSCSESTETF